MMKRTKANKTVRKGVKKIWKKGHSSSFNPKFNKFRLEAKKRAVFGNRGFGSLTEAKLAEHNRLTSEAVCDNDADLLSIGNETAAFTNISAFTSCSMPTFSRLLKNWNAGSILHKEMIAILGAVTEVLKNQGKEETEINYFCALMTTLQDVVQTDVEITSTVCLISMVVKCLEEDILKSKGDVACNVLMKFLVQYMNSDHVALLRNLLKIVYCFMKVNTRWSDSLSEKLKILLEFTTHRKPKVRKIAQQILCTLINDGLVDSSQSHPGCVVVTEFCKSKLESCGGPNSSKDALYVLSLLETTMGVFPKSSIKLLCEMIFRVMTLSNSIVTSASLKALKGLFTMKPKSENLPPDLNARIIIALYDYQPNLKESQSLIDWLQVMEIAFINLRELDEKLCVDHLTRFYFTAIKCWQSEKLEVHEVLASVLVNVLHMCIDPSGEVFQQYLLDDPSNNPMCKMFHYVDEALCYQYHKAWKFVLLVLSSFFEVIGSHCYAVMLKCLQSLADLHDSYKFPHITELEKAIGMAIQHMGPEVVLRAIPLPMDGDRFKPDFPRSWLLPLLKNYIKKAELRYFVKYFMPWANELKQKVFVLQQEQKLVESKLYEVVWSQIWALLPAFCNEPTDLKEWFKCMAYDLGDKLKTEPTLRITVLSSLRMLISRNIENGENREILAGFSKNYLPILMNLYATEPKDKASENIRLAVYETCKAFLKITNKELCQTFFMIAFERLNTPDSNPFMQQSMIDITRAILPNVDSADISKIYEYCKPLLKVSNRTTRKKAYSVLNEICSNESESCTLFVQQHWQDLKPLLCGSAVGLKPSTRALRLNILGHIVKRLTEKEKQFVNNIVPEAVLCTKENSVKARAAAYNLLVIVGNRMMEWQPSDPQGALCKYVKVLLAGMTGSPHLMSATILAIGRVIYEFQDKMDSNLIHLLVRNVCLLLTSKPREVVVSALSFIKILFSVISTEDLLQHVEFLVKSITGISEDNQRHLRFKAKELFTRLVRKFGYEMISKLVPDSYKKQLTNIRKIEARKSLKKNADFDVEDLEASYEKKTVQGFDAILADSDDEMPLEMNFEGAKISRKRGENHNPVIEEHGEDDIVDLMDPSVNKRLLTFKPEKCGERKAQTIFPVSEDGKIIIIENEDNSSKMKVVKAKETSSSLGAPFKEHKKRKYEESDESDDENNTPGVSRGIHRSLEPKAKKKSPGSEFKAKKAGGDVKKGKMEPYAYVPLNKQVLNKRKQVKMKGQFKSVVEGAKRGAKFGVKKKTREARIRKNK